MVIRFFDKLFTVLKERTCNWDSIFIVRVYLFLGATIYNFNLTFEIQLLEFKFQETRQNW